MTKIRTAIVVLSLLCLLPAPVASAGKCQETYTGSGSVIFSPYDDPHPANGYWIDGCGGKACDDTVNGTIIWEDGSSSTFTIDETSGSNDNCAVKCRIDTAGPYDRHGFVRTYEDGVSFHCDDPNDPYDLWFSGSLRTGADASAVTIFIGRAGPQI
jgi:hypothetical protein